MSGGLLDLTQIRVLGVREPRPSRGLEGTWPCPGCGEERDLGSSIDVRVRNRTGNAMERWVRLCVSCSKGLAHAHAVAPGGDGEEPSIQHRVESRTGEPWLDDLPAVTALMRILADFEEGSA